MSLEVCEILLIAGSRRLLRCSWKMQSDSGGQTAIALEGQTSLGMRYLRLCEGLCKDYRGGDEVPRELL